MLKLLLTRWCNQKWSTGSHELVVLRGQVKALQHGSPHLLWLNDIDWCDLLSKHQYVSDDTFGPRAPGAYFNTLAWRMHHNWYCISLLFEVAFDTSSILLLTPCAHHWIWQIYSTIFSLIFWFAATLDQRGTWRLRNSTDHPVWTPLCPSEEAQTFFIR